MKFRIQEKDGEYRIQKKVLFFWTIHFKNYYFGYCTGYNTFLSETEARERIRIKYGSNAKIVTYWRTN